MGSVPEELAREVLAVAATQCYRRTRPSLSVLSDRGRSGRLWRCEVEFLPVAAALCRRSECAARSHDAGGWDAAAQTPVLRCLSSCIQSSRQQLPCVYRLPTILNRTVARLPDRVLKQIHVSRDVYRHGSPMLTITTVLPMQPRRGDAVDIHGANGGRRGNAFDHAHGHIVGPWRKGRVISDISTQQLQIIRNTPIKAHSFPEPEKTRKVEVSRAAGRPYVLGSLSFRFAYCRAIKFW